MTNKADSIRGIHSPVLPAASARIIVQQLSKGLHESSHGQTDTPAGELIDDPMPGPRGAVSLQPPGASFSQRPGERTYRPTYTGPAAVSRQPSATRSYRPGCSCNFADRHRNFCRLSGNGRKFPAPIKAPPPCRTKLCQICPGI